jgi:hypothetical protein
MKTASDVTPKRLTPQYYVLDNLMGSDELLWVYHTLLSTRSWTLTRSSMATKPLLSPFVSFPGLDIETEGQIKDAFLSGYFRSIIFRVRDFMLKSNSVTLPQNIKRIHVGAKSSLSKTKPHVDSDKEGVWTILGFLNPVWNASDGGEFFIADQKIQYKSGRFVIFPSNIIHDGGYVRNEKLNYWRVSINIILDS